MAPGTRPWEIFAKLAKLRGSTGATGNVVRDACFAAVAIEHGCVWITTDANHSRFAGLVWRHPLARRGYVGYACVLVRIRVGARTTAGREARVP